MCMIVDYWSGNVMKKRTIKIIGLIYLSMFAFNTIVLADSYSFDCKSFGDLKTDIENIFNFVKILVPLLVIGLSTFDFIKAITEKDDKDIKKSFTKLIKRLVCAVILFFLPVLIELLMNMVTENVCVTEVVS